MGCGASKQEGLPLPTHETNLESHAVPPAPPPPAPPPHTDEEVRPASLTVEAASIDHGPPGLQLSSTPTEWMESVGLLSPHSNSALDICVALGAATVGDLAFATHEEITQMRAALLPIPRRKLDLALKLLLKLIAGKSAANIPIPAWAELEEAEMVEQRRAEAERALREAEQIERTRTAQGQVLRELCTRPVYLLMMSPELSPLRARASRLGLGVRALLTAAASDGGAEPRASLLEMLVSESVARVLQPRFAVASAGIQLSDGGACATKRRSCPSSRSYHSEERPPIVEAVRASRSRRLARDDAECEALVAAAAQAAAKARKSA
jgi:hypothetical protein